MEFVVFLAFSVGSSVHSSLKRPINAEELATFLRFGWRKGRLLHLISSLPAEEGLEDTLRKDRKRQWRQETTRTLNIGLTSGDFVVWIPSDAEKLSQRATKGLLCSTESAEVLADGLDDEIEDGGQEVELCQSRMRIVRRPPLSRA